MARWAKVRKRPTWDTTATKSCTPTTLSTPGRSRPRQRQCGGRHLALTERHKDGPTDCKRTTHHQGAFGHRLQLQVRNVARWHHLGHRTGRQRREEIDRQVALFPIVWGSGTYANRTFTSALLSR